MLSRIEFIERALEKIGRVYMKKKKLFQLPVVFLDNLRELRKPMQLKNYT